VRSLPVLPCGGVQFEEEYLVMVTKRLSATVSSTWSRLLAAQRKSNASRSDASSSRGWVKCLAPRVRPAAPNSSMGSEVRLLPLHNSSLRSAMLQHSTCGIHLQEVCMQQNHTIHASIRDSASTKHRCNCARYLEHSASMCMT
jgi:hypothetical protein